MIVGLVIRRLCMEYKRSSTTDTYSANNRNEAVLCDLPLIPSLIPWQVRSSLLAGSTEYRNEVSDERAEVELLSFVDIRVGIGHCQLHG